MQGNGSSAGTAHHIHRTARVALSEAVRRGHVAKNVAEIAKAPQLEEEDIEPYSIQEVQGLLLEASKLRNSVRWVVALALGLRQGEALGLQWEDVDLDAGVCAHPQESASSEVPPWLRQFAVWQEGRLLPAA